VVDCQPDHADRRHEQDHLHDHHRAVHEIEDGVQKWVCGIEPAWRDNQPTEIVDALRRPHPPLGWASGRNVTGAKDHAPFPLAESKTPVRGSGFIPSLGDLELTG
jgi:hypothetical protein